MSAERPFTYPDQHYEHVASPARPPLSRIDLVIVAFAMLCGAAVRIDFMAATGFVIDSDEAIVGLMAKHILEGKGVPVFYYGQHYMGSLEAIMASLSFALFGISNYALQLVPLLWSLALIPLIFLLAREAAGAVAGRFAALLTALPPVPLVTWSFKARGGFIEVLVLGTLVLLFMVRWLRSDPKSLRYPALIGLVSGIGWWVNNQILYFMVPVGLFSAIHGASIGVQQRSLILSVRALIVIGSIGLATFFIGSSPYWWYNFKNGFPSMGMFGVAPAKEIVSHIGGVFSSALPILLGAKAFWSAQEVFPGAFVMTYVIYGALFLLARPFRSGSCSLLVGFICTGLLVFSVSTFGWLWQAPRYLLPLYVGILVLAGAGLSALWERRRLGGIAACGVLLGLNLETCYVPERAVPGEPFVFEGERVARDHTELHKVLTDLGITKVRTNYWIGYRLAFESNEKITFLVFDEPAQIRIPDYEASTPDELHDQVPLLLVPAQAALARKALGTLGFKFEERVVGEYVLLFNLERPAPPNHSLERGRVASVTASGPLGSNGNLDPNNSIDNDLHTRWGTGHFQEAGQSLRIEFKKPERLVSLGYHYGEFRHDHPRGLVVEGERADGTTISLLDKETYSAIHYYTDHESSFRLVFEPVQLKAVTLRQTGRHPIFDWSVAELKFNVDGE